MIDFQKLRKTRYSLVISVACGFLYGVLTQALIRGDFSDMTQGLVMTFGFVFILPFVIGFITVYFSDPEKNGWLYRIFFPWVTSGLCLVFALIAGWEGLICFLMATPVYLFMASVGGIITGVLLTTISAARGQNLVFSFFLVLPMLVAGVESTTETPKEYHKVQSQIVINASAQDVWNNITRVPRITDHPFSIFYVLGFPKPLEATLSHEGLGGVREASFENGLEFIETITTWEDQKTLAFNIHPNPEKTSRISETENITVGGEYFDVIQGVYEIEPKGGNSGENQVVLHLYSRFRLSTKFNFYAGLWSDFFMKDIQNNILSVIKKRSESVR